MRRMISYILSAAFILIFPFVSEAIQDNAMILYYSFDEGKGKEVEDLSGKRNHGTLEGDAKWEKNGKINSGVFFKEQIQKDVVAAPASDSLAITRSLAMEVDEIQQNMKQVLSVSPLDKAATTWGFLKGDRDID